MKNAFSKYVPRLLIARRDDRPAFLVRVAKLSAGEQQKSVCNPRDGRAGTSSREGKESGEHGGCLEVSIGTGRNLRSRVPVRRPLHLYLTTVGPNLEDKWDYLADLTRFLSLTRTNV